MIRVSIFFVLVSATICALGSVRSAAQTSTSRSVWDAVYANEQSKRGEALSLSTCVSCHGEELSGSDMAPALQGADFREAWNDRSAADLFDKIKTTMPAGGAGSLSAPQTADLIAYIFRVNDFPAGPNELPAEAAPLSDIRLRAKK